MPPNFNQPGFKMLDTSQLNLKNQQAFGLDISNILGAQSDNIDLSALLANGDMSKLFG